MKRTKGTTLAYIPIKGCIAENEIPLEGTLYGKTKELGYLAVYPTVAFSSAIDKEAGGSLQFAGHAASVTGELFNEFTGVNEGRMWGVAAK